MATSYKDSDDLPYPRTQNETWAFYPDDDPMRSWSAALEQLLTSLDYGRQILQNPDRVQMPMWLFERQAVAIKDKDPNSHAILGL